MIVRKTEENEEEWNDRMNKYWNEHSFDMARKKTNTSRTRESELYILLFNYKSAVSLLFVCIDFAHHLHISIIWFHSIRFVSASISLFHFLAINAHSMRNLIFQAMVHAS